MRTRPGRGNKKICLSCDAALQRKYRAKSNGVCNPQPDYSPYIPDTSYAKQRISIVTQRPGQANFRRNLLRRDGSCIITGCTNRVMLDAAHIMPFKLCSGPLEYNDLDNGLVLRADLHRAFDKGQFTFTDEGDIIRGRRVEDVPGFIHRWYGWKFTVGQRKYLSVHREWFYSLRKVEH